MRPTVVLLAAGLGTRMRSGLAKAIHQLGGRPLIRHVLDAARAIDPAETIVVLGHQAERVRSACEGYAVTFATQREQLGTGHAVREAADAFRNATGPVMVLCADTPLLTAGTLRDLFSEHVTTRAAVTLLTAAVDDPFGYGRIIRGRSGVMAVVEEKDATKAQKKIREVNAGIYCFDRAFLLDALSRLGSKNAQGEYYLPDVIGLARKKRQKVSALLCPDAGEVLGVNSRLDLARAEKVLQLRTNNAWMLAGVSMPDPGSVFIHGAVSLGKDVTLHPNVSLEGKTVIGEGTAVHSGSRIVDSTIGRNAVIKDHSVIEGSTVGDHAAIGPFAHLRPGTNVGNRAKIGNFVETKKTVIGEGSKASHLAYLGDAEIGKDVNIGAGVITCNYDGFEKHRTVIGDNVFVGSDAQLVAPVTIGKGAVVAAGATVTKNVPEDALAISRMKQENKEGFAAIRRRMKQKKEK